MPGEDMDMAAGSSRVRALEQELNEFAYIVSHDLAAPFRHIRGFTDLLKMDSGAGLTQDQRLYCAHIQAAAEQCNSMLEKLLVYSRLLRKTLELEDCSVMALFDAARLQLGEKIRGSGATFEAGELGRVRVDSGLFAMALREILDNAIKFRRPDAPPLIAISLAEAGGKKLIRIDDNGIGLPDMEAEYLFGMFHRGHADSSVPGCGAGLAIARRILRRHDGELRLVRHDRGARAEILLPDTLN